jgi:hypothetical protein
MTTRPNPLHLLALMSSLFVGVSMNSEIVRAQSATAQSATAPSPPWIRTQGGKAVPAGNGAKPHAWNVGVTEEQKTQAKTLYEEGKRFFTSALFASAAAKYRAALQHWDHPKIHYSLALAQISMDLPVEAHRSIVQALRYGTDGLRPDEHERAVEYRRQLREQIAEVEIVCLEPGAAVTINGKPLFTGPGRVTTLVLPGEYQIIASKIRYITTSQIVALAVGSRTKVELNLLAEDQATPTQVRLWKPWLPWTVVGAGIGLGMVATGMHWEARIATYRRNDLWSIRCPDGCDEIPPMIPRLDDRAARLRSGAYVTYLTSGLLLANGALLVYFNRPQIKQKKSLQDLVRVSLDLGSKGEPGVSVQIPF